MPEQTDAEAMLSAINKITNAYREGLLTALDSLRTCVTVEMAEALPDFSAASRAFSEGYLVALDNIEGLLRVPA
jgi:hypothetical protein